MTESAESRSDDLDPQREQEPSGRRGPAVRVFFPWKAMLIGSIVLTVLINVLGAFR